jgi:hydrogenase small subunit
MTPAAEISMLRLNAGLSCDGDTIAMTGATQPSIEDVLSGAIPWIPKVKLYNPFLAPEIGDEFVAVFQRGAEGKLGPFILVVEGCEGMPAYLDYLESRRSELRAAALP